MGSGIIGKAITFWIFILGALFVAKWTGIADNTEMLVKLLIVVAIFFVGWTLFWSSAKKRAAEKNAAKNAAAGPVSKAGTHPAKKKKKK